MVVKSKGPEPSTVVRIARLITDFGLVHFAHRSDKEPSIVSMIQEACALSSRNGVLEKNVDDEATLDEGDSPTGELQKYMHPRQVERSHVAVPEHSHPGESQSNGIAERAIQDLVDHIRVMKLALETKLNVKLPCSHPIMAWLVKHAAYLLNRCQLGTDGRTPWGRLHGKEASERICEFGERILWYVPKKTQAKLDVRWRHGIFLGRSLNSDQNYIGLDDGSVTCARAMVRLVPRKRWSSDKVGNISGLPMDFKTKNLDLIEQSPEPQEHARSELEGPEEPADDSLGRRRQSGWKQMQDFGYSDNCHRCSCINKDFIKGPNRPDILRLVDLAFIALCVMPWVRLTLWMSADLRPRSNPVKSPMICPIQMKSLFRVSRLVCTFHS